MPEYDISASLDALLSKSWDDVLAENPKFKQATENWGPPPRPKARDRSGARGAAARGAPRNSEDPPRAARRAGHVDHRRPVRRARAGSPARRGPPVAFRGPVARGRPPRRARSNRPAPAPRLTPSSPPGAQTAANYKSVWKPESKPSLSSHLTGYINDGKFEASSLVPKSG